MYIGRPEAADADEDEAFTTPWCLVGNWDNGLRGLLLGII